MELRATQLKKKIAAEVSKRLPCVRGAVSRRLTEGLPPHQRFASMADRCSRSPNYVSAPQISTAPKTTLLTGSSGIGEATFFAPDRSFSDLSKFQLRKSILQPRFARQLPLHKGAFFDLNCVLLFPAGAVRNTSVGAIHESPVCCSEKICSHPEDRGRPCVAARVGCGRKPGEKGRRGRRPLRRRSGLFTGRGLAPAVLFTLYSRLRRAFFRAVCRSADRPEAPER